MQLYVTDIIEKVKINIDEISTNDSEDLDGQDNEEMELIIRQKILDGLKFVKGNADWEGVEPDTVLNNTANSGTMTMSGLVGRVSLPADYLRLCYAKFDSWPLYVSDVVAWDEPEYAMLSDKYATGTYERPKVALVKTPDNVLELYSAKQAGEGWKVGIVTVPQIKTDETTGDEYVNISEKLKEALLYYISGLVLLTYNDQHADDMFNQSLVLMGRSPKQATTTD